MTTRSAAPDSIDEAEADLQHGNLPDAAGLAVKAMGDPNADHGRAQYVLARVDLMQGRADDAMAGFQKTLTLSHDPRTIAWSHIYMGRMLDTLDPPQRAAAVEQYQAALASRDSRPDTKQAATSGIAKPFALPRRANAAPAKDDADFDPTGKAQKEAWHPSQPQ